MNESMRTTVKCQDPGDGSEDVIIDLPDDILERMGLHIGDSLTIELIDGFIVLKPICDADAQPQGSYRPEAAAGGWKALY